MTMMHIRVPYYFSMALILRKRRLECDEFAGAGWLTCDTTTMYTHGHDYFNMALMLHELHRECDEFVGAGGSYVT